MRTAKKMFGFVSLFSLMAVFSFAAERVVVAEMITDEG